MMFDGSRDKVTFRIRTPVGFKAKDGEIVALVAPLVKTTSPRVASTTAPT